MIPTKKEHFQQIIRNRIFWPKFKAHDFSPNFSPSSSAEKKLFRNGFLSSSICFMTIRRPLIGRGVFILFFEFT